MRNSLLFILAICTTPLVSHAQLFGESRYTKEAQEIILNQREHGVEKFTIRVERKVSQGKIWKDKYRYRFINDSTLQVREGMLSERYIIRNNEILEPEYEADSAWLANYNKDKIYTQSNISGFDTRRQYQLKGNDTLLIREDAVKKELYQTTMIHKYFVDTVWRIHKTIISQPSDSTHTTSYFVYQNGYWCKRLEISETITHKGNQSYVMTQSIQRTCSSSETNEITQTDLSYRTVTRFYDGQGLIRMIEIDNPDTHFGYFAQLKVVGKSRKKRNVMKTLFILLIFPNWIIAQENGHYESLSAAFAEPEKVIHLELWSLEITELPKEIGRLKNVKSIVLRNNQLTTLPKQFRKLKNLEELSLGSNDNLNPQQVCKVLSKLPKLRQLDLESTNLRSIPDELLFFPSLTELFLGHNSISIKEIEQFKQLRPEITVYE